MAEVSEEVELVEIQVNDVFYVDVFEPESSHIETVAWRQSAEYPLLIEFKSSPRVYYLYRISELYAGNVKIGASEELLSFFWEMVRNTKSVGTLFQRMIKNKCQFISVTGGIRIYEPK